MSLTQLEIWEQRLRQALDKVDAALEAKYGKEYPLRPNRPSHGTTSNPKYDGLFSVDAKFSLGLATGHGPNYVVELRAVTFKSIPANVWQDMLDIAQATLQASLVEAFPDRLLRVSRNGDYFHITGDLAFGKN